jgi:hypothetical protein
MQKEEIVVGRGLSRRNRKIERMEDKEESPNTVFSDPNGLGWRTK